MVLDQTMNLQVVSDGSSSTSDPEVYVSYIDWTPDPNRTAVPAPKLTVLNDAVDVTVLSAPVNNHSREVQFFSCYNKDSITHAITVKMDYSSAEGIIVKQSIQSGHSLLWDKQGGWSIL